MNIEKLLSKGEWKGAELGKLYISIMADLYRQSLEGVRNTTPLIPFDKLKEMVKTLDSKTEGKIYNGYLSIYEWITLSQPCCGGMEQQAYVRFQQLQTYLEASIVSEEVFSYSSSLPVIMTEEQLQEAKKETAYTLLHLEDGKPVTETLAYFINRALSYYVKQLEAHPEEANPLLPIKEKYQNQKVNSEYIKKYYNQAVDRCYYTLPDGRRSDEMSTEAWNRAIYPEYFKEVDYRAKHGEASTEWIDTLFSKVKRNNSLLFDGIPLEAIPSIDELEDIEAGRRVKQEKHYYTEPPEGLTKWNILSKAETLEKCYKSALSLQAKQSNSLEELEDFTEEFKEAIEAVIADIDQKYFNLIQLPEGQAPLVPSINSIPTSEWLDCKVNWTDLYINNVYGFKEIIDSPVHIFFDNERALDNGVAILSKEASAFYNKDFKEPVINISYKSKTLEGFFPDSEYYAHNTKTVQEARELLAEGYYFIKGYNKILDMIADYYKIPDIRNFKNRAEEALENCISTYNELPPLICKNILENHYTDKELQKKKLSALRDNFRLIPYERMNLQESSLQEVEKAFKNFKAFSKEQNKLSGNMDWLTTTVCRLPLEYLKEL